MVAGRQAVRGTRHLTPTSEFGLDSRRRGNDGMCQRKSQMVGTWSPGIPQDESEGSGAFFVGFVQDRVDSRRDDFDEMGEGRRQRVSKRGVQGTGST